MVDDPSRLHGREVNVDFFLGAEPIGEDEPVRERLGRPPGGLMLTDHSILLPAQPPLVPRQRFGGHRRGARVFEK